MDHLATTELKCLQQFCEGQHFFTTLAGFGMQKMPTDSQEAAAWMKRNRDAREWSTTVLADRARAIAREQGDPIKLTQQSISGYETRQPKRVPHWMKYVQQAFSDSDGETANDTYLGTGLSDDTVMIQLLPTFAGMGGGGTGEGDAGTIAFSRDLVERELRSKPDRLLAMVAEGNSMEPDFRGGDQILVDTTRTSFAQPGAFCLWDGDGHVIKFLERLPDTDPPRVRVVSANNIYQAHERLVDEVRIIGRVVWYGRRVQ